MTSRQAVGQADKLVQRYLAHLDAALQGVDKLIATLLPPIHLMRTRRRQLSTVA